MKTFLIISALCCLGLHPALSVAETERDSVVRMMQEWESAVEARDYGRLADFYTEGAIFYPTGVAPIRGRDAIIERNKGRGSAGEVEITQQVDDVQVNGNWAVYSCLARVQVTPAAGEAPPAARFVRVLLLLEKGADGKWRIHRDIDTTTPETFGVQ